MVVSPDVERREILLPSPEIIDRHSGLGEDTTRDDSHGVIGVRYSTGLAETGN